MARKLSASVGLGGANSGKRRGARQLCQLGHVPHAIVLEVEIELPTPQAAEERLERAIDSEIHGLQQISHVWWQQRTQR